MSRLVSAALITMCIFGSSSLFAQIVDMDGDVSLPCADVVKVDLRASASDLTVTLQTSARPFPPGQVLRGGDPNHLRLCPNGTYRFLVDSNRDGIADATLSTSIDRWGQAHTDGPLGLRADANTATGTLRWTVPLASLGLGPGPATVDVQAAATVDAPPLRAGDNSSVTLTDFAPANWLTHTIASGLLLYEDFESGLRPEIWDIGGAHTAIDVTTSHGGARSLSLRGADLDGGQSYIHSKDTWSVTHAEISLWFNGLSLADSTGGRPGNFHVYLVDQADPLDWGVVVGQNKRWGNALGIYTWRDGESWALSDVDLTQLTGWHKLTIRFAHGLGESTVEAYLDGVLKVTKTATRVGPLSSIYIATGGQYNSTSSALVDDVEVRDLALLSDGFERGLDATRWEFGGSHTTVDTSAAHGGLASLALHGADLDGGQSYARSITPWDLDHAEINLWFSGVTLGEATGGRPGNFHVYLADSTDPYDWGVIVGQNKRWGDALAIYTWRDGENWTLSDVDLTQLTGWHLLTIRFARTAQSATIDVLLDGVSKLSRTASQIGSLKSIEIATGGQYTSTSEAKVDDVEVRDTSN